MKSVVVALMTLVLLAGTAWAEPEKKSGEKPQDVPTVARKVAMVNAAGLDKDLMDRVVNYVEKNMRIGVRELPPIKPFAFESLDAQADALEDFLPSQAYCMVGLATIGEEDVRHGLVHPHEQVAVLNATALKPAGGDAETYAQRLEKESIRCIALLAGLPPCVSPRCALWHYADDAGLDRKGRTLCPPCHRKYQELDLATPAPAGGK